MSLQALALTLRLAILVSLILMAIALPLGYWLAFSRWRWKFLIEAVVALPIVLPPTVLGFYVLVAIGPLSPVGRWYHAVTGGSLAFTFRGLVVGSVLYSLPFAVQPIAAAFSSVDRTLLNASATLGEFGVVLMIGGNIPGATQTVSIWIYDQVQSLNYAAANRMAVLLLIVCFVILTLLYGVRRNRKWGVWGWQ